MKRMRRWDRPLKFVTAIITVVAVTSSFGVTSLNAEENPPRDGSATRPLQVLLIPADTGADTTLDDFKPVFSAIQENYGLHFELRVGTSYGAVVEGLVAKRADIAFVGPVGFHQARLRHAAELLAVAVKDNSSSYYAAILTRKDSGVELLNDLRGKRIALGDINSTSSFRFPVAMLQRIGIDPVVGLGQVVITGSHSNALAALREAQVDAAGCSLAAYEKAINSGAISRGELKVLAISPAIPNPPLVMHPDLSDSVKERLREAFREIHRAPGVRPEMIRGYGGDRYERFDVSFPQEDFDRAIEQLAPVTQKLIASIIEQAANR
ncbi:phosphate/phosphite/phosphonate ABC transporter substrate-binding protein [Blastopirellula marina]|uniref:Phosphate/phosphite/phosphonate ABC transporter substrate-binding protein n=2 Tax=Blastopirellula marina TaxID=124 RepID=A0A2S8GEE1_9BACT|nr:phosphate/phosphite/phosphonate ABC transporter substrate-binding protein [Blastopirellula marina]PTL46588.1 phosphate/phosphite/phosphonate ABC transporter substrate-binding protein [Blastopirellula marina]